MTQPDPRQSFSNELPGFQLAYDSVSTNAAKKCLRYYKLAIVDGWQGRGSNIHLRFGQLYHRALEVYDHKIFEGADHQEASREMLKDLAIGCQDTILITREEFVGMPWASTLPHGSPPLEFLPSKDNPDVMELRSWWNPEEGLSEKQQQYNTKTLYTLFRTVVWYLELFGPNDSAKTLKLANGKPAVELSFRFQIGDAVTGEPLLYAGHMDRMVEFSGDLWVLDRKTTKNTIEGSSSFGYFAQFNPHNQFSGYTYAGNVVFDLPVKGVLIDAAQIAKGFSRFVRGFTTRTRSQLDEWMGGITDDLIPRLQRAAETGHYPMNENSCDSYGGCVFRGICSKDPKVRGVYLQSDFAKRPWDPLAIRGDI